MFEKDKKVDKLIDVTIIPVERLDTNQIGVTALATINKLCVMAPNSMLRSLMDATFTKLNELVIEQIVNDKEFMDRLVAQVKESLELEIKRNLLESLTNALKKEG